MSQAEVPAAPTGLGKRYVREPAPGGRVPDLGRLLSGSFDDLMDHLAGYAILSLVKALITFPVLLVCILLVYFIVFVVYLGGLFGGALMSVGLGAAIGGTAGELVAALGFLLTFALVFLGMAVGVMVAMLPMAFLAPIQAGAWRAVARHQRGELKLEGTEFLGMSSDGWLNMIVLQLVMMAAVGVGLLFFYVGAIVPSFLFMFAPGLVALHGMSWHRALRTSARHAIDHLSFHVPYAAVYFGISMLAAYVPFLGAAYLHGLQVRTYREIFGDGEEPLLRME